MGDEAKVRQMREQIQSIRSILLNQQGSTGTATSTTTSTPSSSTPSTTTTTTSASSSTYQLNSQILPPHRIAFTSTTKGRIAFVRQLSNKAEFVIDYDTGVKNELERFGFRVLLYPKMMMNAMKVGGEGEGGSTTSSLGKFLIP